ncbi:hypothetical protein LCGC14_2278960 [marine sediment metagenome]|uniref:Uncharacterized protein n=1 Tax=marine sediment metagenome TaxID=412755 RepID=A0A0F9DGY2_9ZZZZ
MSKDIGGPLKNKSSAGKNSANTAKTGSRRVRNYDPKNTGAGGGAGPSIAKSYKPAAGKVDNPTAPSKRG